MSNGWTWRVLTILAIIFDAGIGGTWLGTQMELGLPHWWGLLGAILAGLAVYGGVELAVHGDRKGIFVALCGILPSIAFAHQYFDARGHGLLLAAILAGFPPGIAVLGGIVAASAKAQQSTAELARAQRLRQQRLDDQQRRRQQQLDDEERAYRRQETAKAAARNAEMEQRKAELQAKLALARVEAEAVKAREAEAVKAREAEAVKAREAEAARKAQEEREAKAAKADARRKAREAEAAQKAESAVSVADDSDNSAANESDKSAANESAVIPKPTRSKKDIAFELLDADSNISNRALAAQVGIGGSTARSYRAQWRKAGQKTVLNGHH